MLDAEAAAGMRRRPQPQPIAWDTQSHRHDRVHGKRALEIGDDLVGLFAGEILGDHDKAFDRRGGIARVAGRDRNPMLGFGKGGLGITVAGRPFRRDAPLTRWTREPLPIGCLPGITRDWKNFWPSVRWPKRQDRGPADIAPPAYNPDYRLPPLRPLSRARLSCRYADREIPVAATGDPTRLRREHHGLRNNSVCCWICAGVINFPAGP